MRNVLAGLIIVASLPSFGFGAADCRQHIVAQHWMRDLGIKTDMQYTSTGSIIAVSHTNSQGYLVDSKCFKVDKADTSCKKYVQFSPGQYGRCW